MARSTHTSSLSQRNMRLAIAATLAAIFAIGLSTADEGLQGQISPSLAGDQSMYLNRPTGMNNLYIGPGTASIEIQFKNAGNTTWDQTVSMFYAQNFGAAKLDLPVIAIGNRQLTYTRDLGSVTPIDKVTPGGTVSFSLSLKAPVDPKTAGCVPVPTRPAQVKGLGTYDQWNSATMLCMFYPQLQRNGKPFGELGTYAMYVLPATTTVKPVTPVATPVSTPQAPLPTPAPVTTPVVAPQAPLPTLPPVTTPIPAPVPQAPAPNPISITVTAPIPACGNRSLDAGEQCEDGNVQDGDGCSSRCSAERCGDGVQQANEQCDDGNNQGGDGCNHVCKLEVCGDNIIQSRREMCDDGNTTDGDGCSSVCAVERKKVDIGPLTITGMSIDQTSERVTYSMNLLAGTTSDLAEQISFQLTVDPLLQFDPASSSRSCAGAAGTVTCKLEKALIPTTEFALNFKVLKGPDMQNRCAPDGTYPFAVPTLTSLTSATEDPNPANNVISIAAQNVALNGCFDRAIKVSGTESVDKGGTLTLTARAACEKGKCVAIAGDTLLVSGLIGFTPVTNAPECQFNAATGEARCAITTIEPAQYKDFIFTLKAGEGIACNAPRMVVASFAGKADLNLTNETTRISVNVTCPVAQNNDVGIVMTMPPTVSKTEIAPVTTKLTNSGPGTATNVTVQLQPMSGVAIDTANTDTRCNATTKVCTVPSIAAGETVELKIGLSSSTLACESWTWISSYITSTNDTNINNNSGFGYSRVTCPAPIAAGSLYVSKDITPVRNHQLLAGELGETSLRLNLRADTEDIEVTDLMVKSTTAESISALELYTDGATAPFASATVVACADLINTNAFCAKMMNRQLIVPKGTEVKVNVRPRIKSDQDGAVAAQSITLSVPGLAGANAVRARGVQSTKALIANNGNMTAEGEVFIGPNGIGSNAEIVGNPNVVVFSKFASIMNANPDANGTFVPTGVASIGQFKFTAMPNVNSRNGLNKSRIEKIMLSVQSNNVLWDSSGFRFYNKDNSSVSVKGVAVNANGFPMTGAATGNFHVVIDQIEQNAVNATMGAGETQTFVLQGNILNPKISAAQTSTAQVVLTGHSTPTLGAFGVTGSHILWSDVDAGGTKSFLWIESPETIVKSTSYQY